jgi:NADH-quinone oxidoreductase subunit J
MTLSGWESVFFWVFAVAALVAALLTILAQNAVHSALFLISTLVSVAALYILLGAEFIAGAQILVYVGGVMVLFLFVIMLVNVSAEERGGQQLFNRTPQVAASFVLLFVLALGLISAVGKGAGALKERAEGGRARDAASQNLPAGATGVARLSRETERVGGSLYRFAALPFEIASVLLLVAIVGSVLLARTSRQEQAADDLDPALLPEDEREEAQPAAAAAD